MTPALKELMEKLALEYSTYKPNEPHDGLNIPASDQYAGFKAGFTAAIEEMSKGVELKLPECPSYIAHPQSVWFHEHWRPVFNQLSARVALAEQENAAWKVKNDTLKWDKVQSQLTAARAKIAELEAAFRETDEDKFRIFCETVLK